MTLAYIVLQLDQQDHDSWDLEWVNIEEIVIGKLLTNSSFIFLFSVAVSTDIKFYGGCAEALYQLVASFGARNRWIGDAS